MEHLEVAYRAISTILRCRIISTADVPFDRKEWHHVGIPQPTLWRQQPDAVEELS